MDDDLGDSRPGSSGYGGKLCPGSFRTGGSIWAAENTTIKVELYTEGDNNAEIAVFLPDSNGNKQVNQGSKKKQGLVSNTKPLTLTFNSTREGYYRISARLKENSSAQLSLHPSLFKG